MRALVVIAGTASIMQELTPRFPSSLIPCVDRPVLQHVVEHLIDRGIVAFDFVLHQWAHEIEDFLGDGTRWGSHFTFHLVRDPNFPYEPLKLLRSDGAPILLIHGDQLPILPDRELLEKLSKQDVLLYAAGENGLPGEISDWSGSAILQPSTARSVPVGATQQQLEQHLRKFVGESSIANVEVLDFREFHTFLAAQGKILNNSSGISHLGAREVEPGIWIARNVVIHPTAQLVRPLFIGENSRIGASTTIGPNAVVGHDSIIDQHTEVIHSAVMPGSYCGERLELDHVIVDRNRLVSSRLGAAVNISDTFILSSLRARERKHSLRSFLSRSLAFFLFILTLPLVLSTGLLLLFLRGKAPLHRKQVAKIPTLREDARLHTFNLYTFRNPGDSKPPSKLNWVFLDFLPALCQVVVGKLHLIGVGPRTEGEIRCMPEDWRTLYLQARAGLLTEALVVHGPLATDDEVYSCEAYYTAVEGFGHDLSLAVRFVTGVA